MGTTSAIPGDRLTVGQSGNELSTRSPAEGHGPSLVNARALSESETTSTVADRPTKGGICPAKPYPFRLLLTRVLRGSPKGKDEAILVVCFGIP